MSFTFRYFLLGIFCLLLMSGHLLARMAMGALPGWLRLDTPQIAVFAILLELMRSLLVGYHAKWNDLALTVSPLRDHLSVAGYGEWMKSWLQAGEDLRTVAMPKDHIYLTQGLATAALTDSYLRDQFYAPPKWSKFDDFQSCRDQNCVLSLADYILTYPGANSVPAGFEVWRSYSNIQILRRVRSSPQQ